MKTKVNQEGKPIIKLEGENGNAFNLIAIARKGLRDAGSSKAIIDAFVQECKQGNYNNVLGTITKYRSLK